jgi:hypothetical protein
MSLGEKKTHTGIVTVHRLGGASKSAGKIVHSLDRGDGNPLPLRLKDSNAMYEPSLDAFVGKRVHVEGIEGSGMPFIFVEKLSDIVVLGPPGRPGRPAGPKFGP